MPINPRSRINRFMQPTRNTEFNMMLKIFNVKKKIGYARWTLVSSLLFLPFSFSTRLALVLSWYRNLSSNTSSSALTVADKTKDELQKDYEQREPAPPSSFTNSYRTIAMPKWRRSGAICNSNSDSGIHKLLTRPHFLNLVSPAALDTTAGEQNELMMTMVNSLSIGGVLS